MLELTCSPDDAQNVAHCCVGQRHNACTKIGMGSDSMHGSLFPERLEALAQGEAAAPVQLRHPRRQLVVRCPSEVALPVRPQRALHALLHIHQRQIQHPVIIQVLQDRVKAKSQSLSSRPAENRLINGVCRTRILHLDLNEVNPLPLYEWEFPACSGVLDIPAPTSELHQVPSTHDSPDTENGHIDIKVIHGKNVVFTPDLNVQIAVPPVLKRRTTGGNAILLRTVLGVAMNLVLRKEVLALGAIAPTS